MKYTREFKESAIQLALNRNEEIKILAQDLGMNAKHNKPHFLDH